MTWSPWRLLLALASCAFLAWNLERTLTGVAVGTPASLGFLVTGSVAPTMFLPQAVMSENVALFGMAGALWLASPRVEARRLRRPPHGGGISAPRRVWRLRL